MYKIFLELQNLLRININIGPAWQNKASGSSVQIYLYIGGGL